MAGSVRADVGRGLPGTSRVVLYPRGCPCATNGARPLCVEGDTQAPWFNLCAFLYGVQVRSGGMVADLRSTEEIGRWLSFQPHSDREYRVLCLRRESAGTEAGARLRN